MWRWWGIVCVLVLCVGVVGAQDYSIHALAWNASAEYLAVARFEDSLEIVDRGGLRHALVQNVSVSSMIWSPTDPMVLAVMQPQNGIILFRFELDVGLHQERLFYSGEPRDFEWSLDGTKLAITDEAGETDAKPRTSWVAIWDAQTGNLLTRYTAPDSRSISDVEWRPGHPDKLLISMSKKRIDDFIETTLMLWNSATEDVIWETIPPGLLIISRTKIAWNATGDQFASLRGLESLLSLHDGQTGEVIKTKTIRFSGIQTEIEWFPFRNALVYSLGLTVVDMETLEVLVDGDNFASSINAVTANARGEVTYKDDKIRTVDMGLEPVAP